MQAIVLIAYPVVCHFAMVRNDPQLQLAALVVMGLGLNIKGLLQFNWLSWGLMVLILSVVAGLFLADLTRIALFLPPIVLPLLLWGIFYSTLGPDEIPLITRIAISSRGELSPAMRDYTRSVTRLWTWFFAAIALLAALLALFASAALWSLVTNVLNWVFIASLFIGEFVYRQWRFKQLEHPSFWNYLLIVFRADIRKLG